MNKVKKGLLSILENLKNDTLTLYAIVDSAREEGLYLELDEVESFNLFRGEEATLLEEVAPYLIRLEGEDSFTEKLLNEQYGNFSLLFFQSNKPMNDIAEFFRDYTKVTIEGEVAYFAFYDPRVFKRFILKASSQEQEKFFSVAEAYFCEDAEDEEFLLHYYYDEKLICDEIGI